uniref:Salicylate carboxymethyltransferase n=1 Tax=Macrostomum lignano TaxID=282301 RepID=A0A1I8HPK6_9PLAT
MSAQQMSSEATAKRNLKMQPDYNRSSRNQASSLQRFKPFIDAAVAAHTSDLTESRGPFVIADFGCSTGLNSSDAVSHLIREVRAKYASSQSCSSVLVVLNDMPHNQWSVLFDFLNGDQRSFLKQLPGVFAVTSGISFYDQVLPPSSLQIGISNICLHWCSQLPTKLSNHGFSLFGTEKEQEAFRKQASQGLGQLPPGEVQGARQRRRYCRELPFIARQGCASIFDEIYKSVEALRSQAASSSRSCSCRAVAVRAAWPGAAAGPRRSPQSRSSITTQLTSCSTETWTRFVSEYVNSCRVTCESTFSDALQRGPVRGLTRRRCAPSCAGRAPKLGWPEQPRLFEFTWRTVGVVLLQ